MQKPKRGLKKGGAALFAWLTEHYDIDGLQPLVIELCHIKDRLDDMRSTLKAGVAEQKKNQLLNTEVKLSAQFVKLWRALGLSDEVLVPGDVGRPTGRR